MTNFTLQLIDIISELGLLMIITIIFSLFVLYQIGINKLADLICDKVMAKIERSNHSKK